MIDDASKAVQEQLFARNDVSSVQTKNDLPQVSPSHIGPQRHCFPDRDPAQQHRYELSSVQTPILHRELYSPQTSINSQILQMRMHGQVAWDLLEMTIRQTVDAHDALRLRLVEEDGHILQYFTPPRQNLAMSYVTLTDPASLNTGHDWTSEAIAVPFNLIDSPLCKFYLIRFSNGERGFAFHSHQLICDRRSMWLTVTEIRRRISSSSRRHPEIAAPAVSVIDFLNKEQQYLHSPRYEWDRRYWITRSKSVFLFSTLKKYSFRLDSLAINTLRYSLDEQATTNIRTFCTRYRITLYQFFLAVTALLLSQRTNRDHVALGQCVTRRFHKTQSEMIGACEVVLPLALRVNRNSHFLDLLHHAASARRELQRHGHFPVSSITQILEATHTGLHLLFDLLLQYCPGIGLDQDLFLQRAPFSEYPLTLCLQECEQQNRILLEWDFQICAWTPDEVAELQQNLLILAQNCMIHPLQPLAHCAQVLAS